MNDYRGRAMGEKTEIQWTDSTWNPVVGCTKVSTGCKFCYAERVSKRMGQEFTKVTLHPERLDEPLKRRKPSRVFVCSVSDLFHQDVPEEFIDRVLWTIFGAEQHTFQILTKRAERMAEVLGQRPTWCHESRWPLRNLWVGVSAEDQKRADERIPILLDTPAKVRFVSLEPLLSGIDLLKRAQARDMASCALDWVIVGGQSGGDRSRWLVEPCARDDRTDGVMIRRCEQCQGTGWRPKAEALKWVRSLRDACQASGVPFHFKGLGGPFQGAGGDLLDGWTHHEFPRLG